MLGVLKGAHAQTVDYCTATIRNFLEPLTGTDRIYVRNFDHRRQKLTNGSRNLDRPISYCLPVFNYYDIIIRFNLLAGGEAAGCPASHLWPIDPISLLSPYSGQRR